MTALTASPVVVGHYVLALLSVLKPAPELLDLGLVLRLDRFDGLVLDDELESGDGFAQLD